MTSPQAGWYQDPQNAQFLRYWDGAQWTEQTQQQVPTLQAPQPTTPGYSSTGQASWAAAPVSFVDAVRNLFLKPSIRGRASRSEYWFAALAYVLVWMVTGTVSGVVTNNVVSAVVTLVHFVVLIELLLVAVRRYHDRGRSGAWVVLHAVLSVVMAVVAFASLLGAGLMAMGDASESAKQFGIVGLVAGALFAANFIWSIVWLTLPGRSEQNRYDS